MFKKIILSIVVILAVATGYLTYVLFINPKSPRGTAEIENETLNVSVTYFRPFKKERLLFGTAEEGALVPYDTYWRLGANMSTQFETESPISFHGRQLAAGTYRMYAIPYPDHWILALNTEAGAFGYYPPDYTNDVMRVNVPSKQSSTPIEQFTIDFVKDSTGVSMRMRWDTTAVLVGIK